MYRIWRKLHILAQSSKQLNKEYSTIEVECISSKTQLQGVKKETTINLLS